MPHVKVSNNAFCDLHVHTSFSDGICVPHSILASAKGRLTCLAFTDHHTTRAFEENESLQDFYGIHLISGVEISTAQHSKLHILGYGMKNRAVMNAALAGASKSHREQIIEALFEYKERYQSYIPDKLIDQLLCHPELTQDVVANKLAKHGFERSPEVAMKKLEKFCFPAQNCCKLSVKDTIELIRRSGGVAVMAHPNSTIRAMSRGVRHKTSFNQFKREFEGQLDKLVGYGLGGIESLVAHYNPETVDFYMGWARNHHIINTGGSDFHGIAGTGGQLLGSPHVKQKHVEILLDEIRKANSR